MMSKEPVIQLFSVRSLPCGEGPVWDTANQRLFWTDSAGEEIIVAGGDGTNSVVFSAGVHAASLTLHEAGGLMGCGKHGFYRLHENKELHRFAESCEGIPVTDVNDIIADAAGRVFGGQEAFRETEAYDPGYLFRLDPGGAIQIVDEGLHLANGMGFSPDGGTFYLVDTIPGTIYQYDYHPGTGAISNKRVLVRIDREEGIPDGLTVDAEGFVWIARWFGGGLSRYDPDGKLERKIALPIAQPTSLCFGGPDLNEIFVTSASVQWESDFAPTGHSFSSPRGGGVYRILQEIRGRAEHKARI